LVANLRGAFLENCVEQRRVFDPGIFVGSYLAIRIPERALRLVLATTLFVVASRIAYDHATTATAIFTAFSRKAIP
jgi:hypothetical protein